MNLLGILFLVFATGVAIDMAIRIYVFSHTDDYDTKAKTKHMHWWWLR